MYHARICALVTLLFFFFVPGLIHAAPWPQNGQTIILFNGANIAIEPSGSAYRNHWYYIPSDDGRVLKRWDQPAAFIFPSGGGRYHNALNENYDLEGATFALDEDPYLYLAVERERDLRPGAPAGRYTSGMIRINPLTGGINPEDHWYLDALSAVGSSNSWAEGLTFLPNAHCHSIRKNDGTLYNNGQGSVFKSGGLFLFARQADGALVVYDIDTHTPEQSILVRVTSPFTAPGYGNLNDMSALNFHPESGLLFAAWDSRGIMGQISLDFSNVVSNFWTFPPGSSNEEGLEITGCGKKTKVVIAEDSGRVVSYTGINIPCANPAPLTDSLPALEEGIEIAP